VPQDDSDNENGSDEEGDEEHDDDDDSAVSSAGSSSDENDSAAAAHAAAIGHSPQPITQRMMAGTSKGRLPLEEGKALQAKIGNGHAGGECFDRDEGASPVSEKKSEQTKGEPSQGMDVAHDVAGRKMETEATAMIDTKETEGEAGPPKEKKSRYYCPYNLNERDNDENTPMHVAILSRKLEHVKLLLEAGASVHKKSDGSPPVHTAISVGSVAQNAEIALKCVQLLYEADADMAAKDEALHTPLYLACMYNLPHIVAFLLTTDSGLSSLNARADRSQGRALHAAAKFDAAGGAMRQSSTTSGHGRVGHLHHPDGTVANALHHIPGFPGKQADRSSLSVASMPPPLTEETVTQVLLQAPGIEVDAQNSVGQTPLHVACARGNWNVVRYLLKAGANPDVADRRGFTPGQHAHKRGMPIPNDLIQTLGGPPSSGTVPPPRDLIFDPNGNTLLLTHELCGLHRTCPPIRRDSPDEAPPENVRRLQVLVDQDTGILRTGEFSRCNWENEGRRAALVDVLKVSHAEATYSSQVQCYRNLNLFASYSISGFSVTNTITSKP
jgi:ankyrin repeat protein